MSYHGIISFSKQRIAAARRSRSGGINVETQEHVDPTRLLKGATVALLARQVHIKAVTEASAQSTAAPSPRAATESGHPVDISTVQETSGSDYMADVIRSLGIEHVASNPATAFAACTSR